MSNTALLVIDVQKSFEQQPFWTDCELASYLRAQNQLIAFARSQQWPVLPVFHLSRGAFACASGFVSPLHGLDLQLDDPVFYKRVHNALSESGLELWLQHAGISRLVISGIRTDQCCETTARFAKDAGYEVEFVIDASLTFDMPNAAGAAVSARQIKAHTELVLHKRFAYVSRVAELIQRPVLSSINAHCPRSGGLVSEVAITEYRGARVGFCNVGCRDSFAADPSAHPLDCLVFDKLIARHAHRRAHA